MNFYEITFITKENLGEKPVKETIEKTGGKILNVLNIGEKQLAYPIKKESRGVYTSVLFELEPGILTELNKKLSLDDEIIRFIVVTKKAPKMDDLIAEEAKATEKEQESEVVETPVETPEVVTKAVEEPAASEEVQDEPEVNKVTEEKPAKVEKEAEKPKVKKATKESKAEKVEKAKKTEAAEITEEAEAEEDRLKALDKKLDELLKD